MSNIFMQYVYIKKEIKALAKRMDSLPRGYVHDYGIDYSSGKGRTIPLEGMADDRPRRLLPRILEDRMEKAEALALEVEIAIANCDDARTRLILDACIVQGRTNTSVAAQLGIDEKTVRRIKRNFLKNAENAELPML